MPLEEINGRKEKKLYATFNMVKNSVYDVIVIGSGIAGLISGCYLAKEGLNVLIVEQHSNAGGYCASFRRKGYIFDSGVHYLGAIKRGVLGKILNELDINMHMLLDEIDPNHKIIMPDFLINIWGDYQKTSDEFQKIFPREKDNIRRFFRTILEERPFSLYAKAKNITFQKFLDEFFIDDRLKSTINVLLANLGVSSNCAPALASIVLFRQYVFDAMYYPRQGVQSFADEIVRKFKDFGGEIVFSQKAKKIRTTNKRITALELKSGKKINARAILSNADATHTFFDLLDCDSRELKIIKELTTSNSFFCVYLGINKKTANDLFSHVNCIARCFTYNIQKQFAPSEQDLTNGAFPLIVITSSCSSGRDINKNQALYEKCTLRLLMLVPPLSSEFWQKNRMEISRRMVSLAEDTVGGFKGDIEVNESAIPNTFQRYTSNKNGAAYGWAMNNAQIELYSQATSVEGLFLAGHWTTDSMGHCGVPGVALSGRKASELILRGFNKKWKYQALML